MRSLFNGVCVCSLFEQCVRASVVRTMCACVRCSNSVCVLIGFKLWRTVRVNLSGKPV